MERVQGLLPGEVMWGLPPLEKVRRSPPLEVLQGVALLWGVREWGR